MLTVEYKEVTVEERDQLESYCSNPGEGERWLQLA